MGDDDGDGLVGPWYAEAGVFRGPVVVRGRVARALVAVPRAGRGRAAIVSVEVWCEHGRWACSAGPPRLPEVLAASPPAWSALKAMGVSVDPFPPGRWAPLAACPECGAAGAQNAEPGAAADRAGGSGLPG